MEPFGQNERLTTGIKRLLCSQFLLTKTMNELYFYLHKNTSDQDLHRLSQLPIICDIENGQMLRPANVVLELAQNEKIRGYIEKAPFRFSQHTDFFRRLGAAPFVTANHYAAVLTQLKSHSGDKPLHVEEMKIVKKAVEGLFRCLSEGTEEQKQISENQLYLPTREGTLQESRNIVFSHQKLEDRLKEFPHDVHLNFFLGFQRLEISVLFPEKLVLKLPKQHQMVMLSDIVKETVPDRVRDVAVEGEDSRFFASKLSDPWLKEAVIRLADHRLKEHNRELSDETATYFSDQLSGISVKQSVSVETVLTMDGRDIAGSETKKVSFAENIQTKPKQSVVYLDTDACQNMAKYGDRFLHSLVIAIQFVLDLDVDSLLLYQALKSPRDARELLDNMAIKQCNYTVGLDPSVIPRPGTFVPLCDHCHLDTAFYDLYEGEHVGYEVHDPLVESDENGDNEAVYIYAVVLHEICPSGNENVPLLAKRYLVDLGPERGGTEVSVTQLYKFKHKTQKDNFVGSLTLQLPETDNQSQDMSDELRKIRQTMTDTWALCGPQERRRVMLRLLLKWHPEKNPGNEKLCTHVRQAIIQYETLLSQSKELHAEGEEFHDDSDEDVVDGGQYRPGSSFSASFFAHTNARSHTHRTYYDSSKHGERLNRNQFQEWTDFHASSRSNPQPGEGRRWYRTAQADLDAARSVRENCGRGHNWVCFQCHQAVEKALKAVVYFRDADSDCLQSHRLPQLASVVGDPVLLQLSGQMESRIGPHVRMRYPDVLVYPNVPSDIYSNDDVRMACDVAGSVLERVQCLI